MLSRAEIFVEYLWGQGVFQEQDIMGKNCLIIGGVYSGGDAYAMGLKARLLHAGAAQCDTIVLFNPGISDSYCDLTDVKAAVGSLSYDLIIVLSGMEKTRDIREGVRQLQEICHVGGKILVTARTPHDVSSRVSLNTYEDIWRYDADSLAELFDRCTVEMSAVDEAYGIVCALLTRVERAAASKSFLFHTKEGKRIEVGDEVPQGYFNSSSVLDAIGIKYRTDKCSMMHNYLDKYAFFLEKFRSQPIRLLELGVFNGSSVRMWQEYFPRAEVFGVDIEASCRQYEEERIHIIQADLSDAAQVSMLREIRPQIIVDDASHIVSHQLLALFTLFDVLPRGGVYILEDLETSLNPELFDEAYRDCSMDAYAVCERIAHIAARKVPDDDSIYADHINRIGMETELVSITKGSVILIKR